MRVQVQCRWFAGPHNKSKQLTQCYNLISAYVNKHPQNLQFVKSHSIRSFSKLSSSPSHQSTSMDVDANLTASAKKDLCQVLDEALCSVMPNELAKKRMSFDGCRLHVAGERYVLSESVYLVGFGKAVASMAVVLDEMLEGSTSAIIKGIMSVPENMTKLLDQPEQLSISGESFPGLNEMREVEIQEITKLGNDCRIDRREGAKDNKPDDKARITTGCIIQLAKSLTKDDTLIVLMSGGGSALLVAPKPPLTLEEKREITRQLQNAGASIKELNIVRKQMSNVKGGALAQYAYPAKVIVIVISDVVHDELDIIASGPFIPMPLDNRQQAIKILRKYKLYGTLSENVRKQIFEKQTYDDMSLVKNGQFTFVNHVIIGNNLVALKASVESARKLDIEGIIVSNTVEGDVRDISIAYAEVAKIICHTLDKDICSELDFITKFMKTDCGVLNLKQENLEQIFKTVRSVRAGKPLLLMAGGEPTVVVKGDGWGGRNQELALHFSLDWLSQIAKNPELSRYFVLFLSAGTDGQDGPTDSAGAFGQPGIRPKMTHMIQNLKKLKRQTVYPTKLQCYDNQIEELKYMLPENVIQRNDSYTFFSKFGRGQNHLKYGLTGTNVMDLHYIYIKKRDCTCPLPGTVRSDVPIEIDDFLFDTSNSEKTESCDNKCTCESLTTILAKLNK